MNVRIFKPAKTAMQSGRAKTKRWVLEFEPVEAAKPDALMGWAGSGDTYQQVNLFFDSCEDAVQYAQSEGYAYRVIEEKTRKIRPKAYADNFAHNRVMPWTH